MTAVPVRGEPTDREEDVLRLLAEGLSDAEGARRPVRHRGDRNRVQAVLHAFRSGRVRCIPGR